MGITAIDKRFWITCLAVLMVTVASAAMAGPAGEPEISPLHEHVSGVEQAPVQDTQPAVPEPNYAFVIREYEGRVAVFTAENDTEPETVLDTLVKYLPDYDRTQMQEGIPVKDYRELVALLEDYSS